MKITRTTTTFRRQRSACLCPCGRAKAKVCALQQSRPKNAERLQGGDTLRVQSVQSCTLPNNVPQFVPRSSRVTHFNLTLFAINFVSLDFIEFHI